MALTSLIQGGAKYQDAFYIFEEFAQSNTSATVKLLNNLAVSNLALGRYPEAESQLLEALSKVNMEGEQGDNLGERILFVLLNTNFLMFCAG